METDFFRESKEKLDAKYRMKRVEGTFNVIFDVKAQIKSELYGKTRRLPIKEVFPDIIRPAFTDSESLNNLQSVIYPSVY